MAIFAIADLHLALGIDKPMDVFGGRWSNYMEKLRSSWLNTVGEEDTIVIPGDISWATYLANAYEDFKYIEALPGKKIISKGNHDYWWTTASKLNKYLNEMQINIVGQGAFFSTARTPYQKIEMGFLLLNMYWPIMHVSCLKFCGTSRCKHGHGH